jgi:hypothetical protein
MILEETQNNITKKIKYSSKTNKKTKNTKKHSNNKKTNPSTNPTTTTTSNINTTPNKIHNSLIPQTKLTKLVQTITLQNTIQLLPKKITLIINEAIASSSN